MSLLLLILMIGASARLTHIVTTDKVSEQFRLWVENFEIDHWGSGGISFTNLFRCPWCIGFWIAMSVAALTWWIGDQGWLQFCWAGLTASYALGYMEEKL